MNRVLIFLLAWSAGINVCQAQEPPLTTAQLLLSAACPDCMAYRQSGICLWLKCGGNGCKIRTTIKVSHYIPEAVVSSYPATGQNPWLEVALLGAPLPSVAEGGGDMTSAGQNRDNHTRFRNVDVIGHPGTTIYLEMSRRAEFCQPATWGYVPYFLSTLDFLSWREGLTEQIFPETWTPGLREIGIPGVYNWGNLYPRQGFLVQPDDYKGSAVMAQRAADIVTRPGQLHVYLTMMGNRSDGYWPPQLPVFESIEKTHKWQRVHPTIDTTCTVFPDMKNMGNYAGNFLSASGGYAWALWRPYSCCKRNGQVFLGSQDF